MKKFVFFLFFFLFSVSAYCQTDLATITTRLRTPLVITTTTVTLDANVATFLSRLNANGSYSDIDYAVRTAASWDPVEHVQRMYSITQAYYAVRSTYYRSATVKAQIKLMLNYWIQRNPSSTNWWWQAIGTPNNGVTRTLTLLKSNDAYGLTQAELDTYADALLKYYSYYPAGQFTSSNLSAVLSVSLYKDCIKNNAVNLGTDFATLFADLRVATGSAEGVKNDGTFYQHGAQNLINTYGEVYLSDMCRFANLSVGTSYSISAAKYEILVDFILEGFQWFNYRKISDFGTIGREIATINNQRFNSATNYVTQILGIHPYRNTELTNYVSYLNGGSFQSPGNRFFWHSDMMTHQNTNFYLSVKAPSSRTIGTETLNNESLKAKFLPWGSTNIMVTGSEYLDIFPNWDWTRVPGVTAEMGGDPTTVSGALQSTTSFAGGVSNGSYGLTAYNFVDNASFGGAKYKKTYFFTPNALYCMGSGITGNRPNAIVTSVNQCIAVGNVTVKTSTGQSTLSTTQQNYTNLNWVHQDKVGYYFPNGGNITVAKQSQTGDIMDINSKYSSSPTTKTVFSTWFNHSAAPTNATYEYIIVPSKTTATDMENWVTANTLQKIANTTTIQAFKDGTAGVFGIAFYAAGNVLLETGLTVSVNKPCVLLITKKVSGYEVSVADPTQLLTNVAITLSKNLSGSNVTSGVNSILNAAFPQGDDAGKTTDYTLSTVIIPVELTTFSVKKANTSDALVEWATASEKNTAFFDIQRSTDGKIFSTIGQVKASGTTQTPKYYEFSDKNLPLSTAGIFYYKLKINDLDESVTFSKIQSIAFSNAFSKDRIITTDVFPNPSKTGKISLILRGGINQNLPTTISVNDLLGRQILYLSANIKSDMPFNLTLDNAVSGVYFIRIENGGNQVVKKWMIQ